MAYIEALDVACHRIPLPVTLSDSTHGSIAEFELITVHVRDADGETGLGFTYTVGSGGRAVHALIDHELRPILSRCDGSRIEHVWQSMWWALHYGGRGGQTALAISAIDIALWDLAAKRAKQPLWRFLGGFDPLVPCYAGGIDLDFSIDQLLCQADNFVEKGFRAIKMKVGRRELAQDVKRVEAMRKHLGDGFPLMADANMRWTVDQSIRAARALADYELVWLEEPTIPDDFAGHTKIVEQTGHPIATGENLHSLYEFKQMIACGGVTFPEPDVSNCGGISTFMKICSLAEAFNLPVTSHGVHDLTVGLLAAVPNRSFLEIHGFGLDRFIDTPLSVNDGFVIASDQPGHGVGLLMDKLKPHRVI